MTPKDDLHWMNLALDEARKGLGLTSPNPAVGAVLVKNGEVIGAGFHRGAGSPHAEVEAIADARRNLHPSFAGATLYVTLEPCSTHGRTPPCTDAIIAAHMDRVVYGSTDPNPVHQSRSDAILRAAGIEVTGGVLQEECDLLIRPFAKWITTGLPYVIVKVGQSLDGRITRPAGESQWLTSEAARVHGRRLRQKVDAILVGAETIRRDDPMLTVRETGSTDRVRQPWRVILSQSGDLPQNAKVFTDAFKDRTFVLSHLEFPEVLRELGRRQITSLLIEGGGIVIGEAFACRQVDEVHWYIAPRLCGGGRNSVAGSPLPESVELDQVNILPMGSNVLVSGFPMWPESNLPHS